MQHFKVAIVGAGPAGSAATLYLKKEGIDCALIDKAKFPRDKACGDGMPMKTVTLLQELGFSEQELFRQGYQIKGMAVYSPQGYKTQIGGVDQKGTKSGCIPRLYFDNLLFQKAQAAAQKCFSGFRLVNMKRESEKWLLTLNNLQKNERLLISADVVIGADGAHSLVGRKAGLLQENRSQVFDGLRRYYKGGPFAPVVHIIYDRKLLPGYLWIFPVAADRVNVGIMTRRRKEQNLRQIFTDVMENNEQVKKILKGVTADGPLRGALLPLGNIPGERIADGVLLTGDAAAFINPVTGGGIYAAILSAREAARIITVALESGNVQKEALMGYENWWRHEILPGFEYAARLKKKLQSERFASWFLRKSSHNRLYRNFFFMLYGRSLPKRSLLNPLFWMKVILAR